MFHADDDTKIYISTAGKKIQRWDFNENRARDKLYTDKHENIGETETG